MNTITKELSEERQFGKTLQSNQSSWQHKFAALEIECNEKVEEITELKEQVRDLMFFLEAQNKIANSELKEEIAGASVGLPSLTAKGAKRRPKK